MVENSIDAGASRVQVLVVDGGKACVQVIDNGKGMSETDARLSFERHATSKIQRAADLYSLHTMGFRGEALASIAAVAQVDLKTRRKEDEIGTCIQLAGSKIESQEPVACPVGANFAVKNLFFNVPARRKFLKSTATELNNIISEFERIVLVYPNIAFTLYNNGTEVYNLPVTNMRQRIVDVFGKKIDSTLLPIEVETSMVRISGYVGTPESARKKGSHQFFFVNGRFMRNPYFHSAVMHAYENLIPVGEHVSYFVYMSVDPSSIDVNVHPTKTEIKFDNEQPIWQVLAAVVKESLGKFINVPTIDFDVTDKPDIPAMGARVKPLQMPATSSHSGYNPFQTSATRQRDKMSDWKKLYGGLETFEQKNQDVSQGDSLVAPHEVPAVDNLLSTAAPDGRNLWSGTSDAEAADANPFAEIETLPHFQYKGRYIVVPIPTGLLLVDQHRAHTRILYEQYIQKIIERKHVSQGLLFPELVQFTAKECVVVEAIKDDLDAIGFDLTSLGGGTYSVTGIPAGIDGLTPSHLLHDLIYAAIERGTSVKSDVAKAIALAIAKSVAIVYGQVLEDDEIHKLLQQLFALQTPMWTPDGKRVFCVIEHAVIEKMF